MHTQRPQRPVADDTRRRLLDSARRVFAADGFSKAKTQDIVDAAGVAPTALYHHFSSKRGLFLATSREVYATFVDYLDQSISDSGSFDAQLQALLAAAGRLHDLDPTLAPMAVTAQLEVQRDPELREELTDSLASFQLLARRIADRAPAALISEHGQRAMTLAIVALLNGLSTLGATLRDSSEVAAAAAALAAIASATRAEEH
jgi:AcrR family transcriptional regulator